MAAGPEGTWQSESGETKVRIAPCGADYCGTIVWAQDNGTDTMNPDPAKRAAPLVGTQMITRMKPSAGGFSGRLYNYKDGKTYSGKLQPIGNDRLKLSGCVMGVFCRSQIWTRAD